MAESLEKRVLLSTSIGTDAGSNSIDFINNNGTVQIFQNQPQTAPPVASFAADSSDTDGDNDVDINDGNGNNTITLDCSGGNPLGGGSLFVYPSGTNAATADTINLINTGGASFTLQQTQIQTRIITTYYKEINFSTSSQHYTGTIYICDGANGDFGGGTVQPNLNLIDPDTNNTISIASGTFLFNSNLGNGGTADSLAASTNVIVQDGASVSFGVTQNLYSLNIQTGGKVAMLPAGQQVLDTTSLTVSGSLDLADNDLIVQSPGSAISTLEGDLATGDRAIINHTTMPTANAIGSSTAVTDDLFVGYSPQSASTLAINSLDGQPIPTGALVGRYTYQHDFNLDGAVNSTDTAILDANYGHTLPANYLWWEGDANLDGRVNYEDFGTQTSNGEPSLYSTPANVTVNDPYTLNLPTQISGLTVVRYDIDWGDGDVDSYDPTQVPNPTHYYLAQADLAVQMSALLADGSSYTAPAIPLAIVGPNAVDTAPLDASSEGANFEITTDGNGNTLVYENGQLYNSYPTANLAEMTLTGDQNGTLTVDFSNVDPLPVSGITTDSAAIKINGTNGPDFLSSTTTAAIFNGLTVEANGNIIVNSDVDDEIRHPSTSSVTFLNAGPGDIVESVGGTVTLAGDTSNNGNGSPYGGPTVFVNTAATVLFTGTHHLSALDILPGGTARMAPDGTAVLVTNSLSIEDPTGSFNGGLLDLADNDMIVHQGNLSDIANWLANGYDGGAWDALGSTPGDEPAAINSTVAFNDPEMIEALGYAQVGTWPVSPSPAQLPITTFDNQPVSPGDVVVKFTYYGDANLDGTVNSTDSNLLNSVYTGWSSGDFSYDGTVDSAAIAQLESIIQSPGLVPATLNLEVDEPFSMTNLPGMLPDGVTPIGGWQVNWGNGYIQTISASTASVPNPYNDAPGTYLASFVALDSGGNPIYRYPHMTITNLLPDLPSYSQPASDPTLPTGAESFSPPVGSQYSPYSTSAPTIVANNLDGQPDDTLTFTGANFTNTGNFSDTQFLVYGQTTASNGTFSDAEIQDPTTNGVLATIPANEPANSMYFVWPESSEGVGSPVAINQTTAQWMEPQSSTSNPLSAGTIVSVYGRNLDNGAGASWIYLQPDGTSAAGQWIYIPPGVTAGPIDDLAQSNMVGDANPYRVRFRVPTNLAAGVYDVWVYNGLGGVYGWSNAGEMYGGTPLTPPPLNLVNVNDYGATGEGIYDEGPDIQNAIATLESNEQEFPGMDNVLYFPAGTYNINTDSTQYLIANTLSAGSIDIGYDGYTSTLPTTDFSLDSTGDVNLQNTLNNLLAQAFRDTDHTVSVHNYYDPGFGADVPYGADFVVTFNGFTNTLPITLVPTPLSNTTGNIAVWGSDQLVIPSNTEVLGDGPTSSVIVFDGNLPNGDVDGSAGFDIGIDDSSDPQANSIKFESIGLTYNGPAYSQDGALVRERGGYNFTFDNVAINAFSVVAIDWEGSDDLTLTNSTIISYNTYINVATDVVLDNDLFLQAYGQEYPAVSLLACQYVSMTNCSTENYADYNSIGAALGRNGYGEGKFVEFIGEVSDVYCASNESIMLGEYGDPNLGGPVDYNSGEQILVDAQSTPLVDEGIECATAYTVTIPGNYATAQGWFLDVTSGPDIGQRLSIASATVSSVSGSGGSFVTKLTLEQGESFTEQPNPGDFICVEQAPSNLVFYQNYLNQTTGPYTDVENASTGIDFSSGYGIVIDDNTINNTLFGIRLSSSYTLTYGGPAYELAPFGFTEIINNIINVIRTGATETAAPAPALPEGIQLVFGGNGEADASYYGLALRKNDINVQSNASGNTMTLGYGIWMQDFSDDSSPIPNDFGVIEYNTITNFALSFTTVDTPNTLVDNNTFILGNGVVSGSAGITFTFADAGPLLFGNRYSGFQQNYTTTYTGNVPPSSTLSVPLDVYYLSSSGPDALGTIVLCDFGSAPISWSIDDPSGLPSWLTIQNAYSGEIGAESSTPSSGSGAITFIADPTGQSAGEQSATITFNYGDGLSRTITIYFIIN